MKWITVLLLPFFIAPAWAQENYDVAGFTAPSGWKRQDKTNSVEFSTTNKKTRTWCQLAVNKATATTGNLEADFNSEWNTILGPLNVSAPQLSEVQESNGWKILTGTGTFTFNNGQAYSILTVYYGYNIYFSVLANTNTEEFNQQVTDFFGSLSINQDALAKLLPVNGNNDATNTGTNYPSASVVSGFAFSSTNFDDGWTSTVQEDWVEVTKGNNKVLLHYPKEGTIFPADPEPLTNAAWNILVAPRYRNLKNYKTTYINAYDRPYLGMGYATENSTGKNVFVLLFRQGQSGWLEFIAPDKNTFIQEYKFDPETIRWDSESALMNPLTKMTAYNKFAIAAADFKGKWTSDFTGIQQLYNVYTGDYAGMQMNQSNEEFIFSNNNTYTWKFLAVNGMAGNAKVSQEKSAGTFALLNNWQVRFSTIESRAKTFNAFWSCIKGARILNLLDADYPGSGIYTKYGLAK